MALARSAYRADVSVGSAWRFGGSSSVLVVSVVCGNTTSAPRGGETVHVKPKGIDMLGLAQAFGSRARVLAM